MLTLSETAGQGPAGSFVVSVKLAIPAAISPALGVYVEVGEVDEPKLPEPPDHVTELAPPPKDPESETLPPLQEAKLGPAFTVAGVLTLTLALPGAEVQPFCVTVKV